MSDLISRNAVVKLLCELRVDNVAVNDKRIVEYIKDLPTAYDVEKVVAELSEKSGTVRNMFGGSTRAIGLRTAIDIVRKGGAE